MANSSCTIEGNTDMYGIGIRIGFYLQWYASPIAAWIVPSEVPGLQAANAWFVSATFLGLVVQIAIADLDIAEIYIILLLTFGAFLFLLPVMLWRILTGFSSRWDPTQWSKTKPNSKTFYVLFSMVQFAELGFQLWFWANFNLVITSLLLGLLLFFFIARFRFMSLEGKGKGKGKEKNTFVLSSDDPRDHAWLADHQHELQQSFQPLSERRIKYFRIVDTAMRVILITIIIAGTELTIFWNDIKGINNPGTAGQLIPLVLGLGAIGHIILLIIKVRVAKAHVSQETTMNAFVVPMPLSLPDEMMGTINIQENIETHHAPPSRPETPPPH